MVGVFGVLVAAQACGSAPDAPAASAASNIVTGVDSPNAKPDAAYLKARTLDSLTRLGALSGNLARLAGRADGTLDPTAADGRLTLDELLALDEPDVAQKLMPAERQVLPQLWSLFETTKDDPKELTVPPIDVILASDVSEPAVEPVDPQSITVASLKVDLQRTANRLEQAHDSDDDPKTITLDDVAAALAAPAGFQPWEVAQLRAIQSIFRDRAGTKLAAKVRVTAPATPPYSIPAAITWGTNVASIGISKTIEYNESRTMDVTKGDLVVTLVGHVSQSAKITMGTQYQLLFIDDETAKETFAASGPLEIEAGTKTVEVWQSGTRVGSYRAKLPKLVAEDTTLDLSQYADHTFVLADGTVLKHNPVDGSATPTGFTATFQYVKDGYGYIPDSVLQGVANPGFGVANGRYALPSPDGTITLELYPEGILKVIRPNGVTERAVYRGSKWVLEGSDLRFTLDPAANEVTVRRADETLLFQGALSGSLRTG